MVLYVAEPVFVRMISRGDIRNGTRSENAGKSLIWQGKCQ